MRQTVESGAGYPREECEELWPLLSVYADGESQSERMSEAAALEAHLSLCKNCAAALDFMRSSSSLLAGLPEVEPPAHLRHAIFSATIYRLPLRARIRRAIAKSWSFAPTRLGAFGAAGAAAALLFFMVRGGQMEQPPLPGVPTLPNSIAQNHAAPVTPIPPKAGGGPTQGRGDSGKESFDVLGSLNDASAIKGSSDSATLRRDPSDSPSRLVAVGLKPLGSQKPPSPRVDRNGKARQPSSDFKVKTPASNQAFEELVEPDEMLMANMPMMGMNTPGMDPAAHPESAGSSSEVTHVVITEPRTTRIVLAAASSPMSTDRIASLADLKKELRLKENRWHPVDGLRNPKDRQMQVDIVRGSF